MKIFKGLRITAAEDFPNRVYFEKRDFFALAIIPLIVIINFIGLTLFEDKTTLGLIDTISRGVLFLIVCFIYKTMLINHWIHFKKSRLSSWLLVIVGAIALHVIITLTRSFLPTNHTSINNQDVLVINLAIFIISFGPVFTALIEDIVFRYTLLQKLFIPNLSIRILVITFNSVLFGLIHYYNFDGNVISTISFMSAGLFLNIVYIWTRNIWHVLLIHAINNFVLSILAVIILWIFQ